MGKGQGPAPSELKFVYKILAEGYSDTDILAKYEDLNKHGKLGSLPYRSPRPPFYKTAKEGIEAVQRILKTPLQKGRLEKMILAANRRTSRGTCDIC